jgi:hypothetical protein
MDEGAWHLGRIYEAWEQIHRALLEAMKPLPRQTLVFLANRATERMVRVQAAELLDWQDNRDNLPDWGWSVARSEERPRRRGGRFCVCRA